VGSLDDHIEKHIADIKEERNRILNQIRNLNKEIIARVRIIKIIRKKAKIPKPEKIKREIRMLENKIASGLSINAEREVFKKIKELKNKLKEIKILEEKNGIKKFDDEIKQLKREREKLKEILDKNKKELRELEKVKRERESGQTFLGDLVVIKKKKDEENENKGKGNSN
jgi:uncharacterized coiled-coil DUF342 family protein